MSDVGEWKVTLETRNLLNQPETLPLAVTCLVLCGGKSSRMGRAKAFLPYKGGSMVSHILGKAKALFQEVFLVTNEPELFEDMGVDVIKDILPHRGPLGGILSGLLVAHHEHSFVLACDMPFIDHRLMREMALERHGHDVLVLMHNEGIEPLVGLYSKNCIKPLEESLFAGTPSLHDFVDGLNAKTYTYNWEPGRGGHEMIPPYFSIDTPQDYSRAITCSLSTVR